MHALCKLTREKRGLGKKSSPVASAEPVRSSPAWTETEELERSLPGEDRLKFCYLFLKDTLGPTSRSICRAREEKVCYPWTVQRGQNLSLADPSQTLAVLLQNVREGEGKKKRKKKTSDERREMNQG